MLVISVVAGLVLFPNHLHVTFDDEVNENESVLLPFKSALQ